MNNQRIVLKEKPSKSGGVSFQAPINTVLRQRGQL